MRILFVKSTVINGKWLLDFSDSENLISNTVYLTEGEAKRLADLLKQEGF